MSGRYEGGIPVGRITEVFGAESSGKTLMALASGLTQVLDDRRYTEIIVTRATELQSIFNRLGKGSSYGNSTTHHTKLWPPLDGGGGGGCPILTFAIRPELYVED